MPGRPKLYLVNPIGAASGGPAGWRAREYTDYPIANWFFGESSHASAASMLGFPLQETQKPAHNISVKYNCSFYIHRIGTHSSSVEDISTIESASSLDVASAAWCCLLYECELKCASHRSSPPSFGSRPPTAPSPSTSRTPPALTTSSSGLSPTIFLPVMPSTTCSELALNSAKKFAAPTLTVWSLPPPHPPPPASFHPSVSVAQPTRVSSRIPNQTTGGPPRCRHRWTPSLAGSSYHTNTT